MTKIVINTCFGGFGLSEAALKRYHELSGTKIEYDWRIKRDDPFLIQVVEELGDNANDTYARLRVIEIPDGIEWVIQEYDGNEHVAEEHRTWR